MIYSLPIYWLAGLNEAPDRFLLNFLLAWLMVYCSRTMALFVAASLPTLQISAFMGNSLFTVFYLTGGFVINIKNMWLGEEAEQMCSRCADRLPLTGFSLPPPPPPPSTVASWISYVSFMRWGYEGMLQVQFIGNKYPVTISNITIHVDGVSVSSTPVKRCSVLRQSHTRSFCPLRWWRP